MLIYKPYLLNNSRLEDVITVLNLVYPGRTFKVGRRLFQKLLDNDYLDDCCFHIVVSTKFIHFSNFELL